MAEENKSEMSEEEQKAQDEFQKEVETNQDSFAKLMGELEPKEQQLKTQSDVAAEKTEADKEATTTESNEANASDSADAEQQSAASADEERDESSVSSESADAGKKEEAMLSKSKAQAIIESKVGRTHKKYAKQVEALQKEKADLEAKLKSAQVAETTKTQTEIKAETEPEVQTEEKETGEVEYWAEDEVPDAAHYATDDEWNDAVDKWIEGGGTGERVVKPPLIQKSAAAKQDEAVQEPEPQQAQASDEKPSEAQAPNIVDMQFRNIQEVLDEYAGKDGYSETLSEDFSEMVKKGVIPVTSEAVQIMEATDDCAKIAQTFIERPRDARRMLSMPESKQREHLQSIIDSFGKTTEKKGNEAHKEEAAPNITTLRGESESGYSQKELQHLAETDQAAFAQLMEELERGGQRLM